ncbi:MAG TPA: DUF4232 domain-containing protein [Mycobacteriales bacterium]|nr:DUF4232 domain-containing protein [Mycobacteriales bacterium]
MDADAVLHPRGPLPSRVYWQRRATTVAAALLVLFVALKACGPGGEDSLRSGASPSPSPRSAVASPSAARKPAVATGSPAPRPAPTMTPASRAAGEPCRDSDLLVSATVAGKEFGPGQRPRLTLAVTNRGPVSCTRDLGGAAREIRVVSGSDRVWSSDDCSPGGKADIVTLAPGATRSFPVTWSRTRSKPGCPAVRPAAAPGTYRVVGRIGALERPGDTFTLR